MTRKQDVAYCSEHFNLLQQSSGKTPVPPPDKGNRIPCPLDPRHSVWEKELARHVRKCNSIKLSALPLDDPSFKLNHNILPSTPSDSVQGSADPSTVLAAITVLNTCYESRFASRDLPLSVKSNHSVELHRFPQLDGPRKHARQQSSLIQHLKENAMFPQPSLDPFTYMEFGCGRAELSRYLNQSVFIDSVSHCDAEATITPPEFLLIDRASNRMKFDKKFKDDLDELYEANAPTLPKVYPTLVRKKMDIKDLYIDDLLQSSQNRNCVAISKHLCGVATDLTITCCLNSEILHNSHHRLQGMLIAMCCRHVCDPYQYVNRPFIENLIRDSSLTYLDFFNALKKIASWAVCGRKPGVKDSDVNNHFTQLSILEREKLGERARRIIDEGRAQYLRDHGYDVSLVRYIESSVSLENVAMIVRKKSTGA